MTERQLPHDRLAEETILAAILTDPVAVFASCPDLEPDHFFIRSHRIIFEECMALQAEGKPVEPASVVSRLSDLGSLEEVGGAFHINQLASAFTGAANAPFYAGRLAAKLALRQAIKRAAEVERLAYSGDDDALEKIHGMTKPTPTGSTDLITFGEVDMAYRAEAQRPMENVMDLGAWLPGFRKYVRPLRPGALVIVAADTGTGKCLAKGTKVMMSDGASKEVEMIEVGDTVMGADSRPRKVMALGHGHSQMYRIEQSNGDDFVCNEDHILCLQRTNNPANRLKGGKIVNISVKDLLARGARSRHLLKGWKAPVEFAYSSVQVDPYFMGLWLGDGNSRGTAITTGDVEIERYIKDFASVEGMNLREVKGQGCSTWHFSSDYKNGLLKQMRMLGVIENKHIPDCYMRNSRHVRLNLLAGLIDSDGNFAQRGAVEFCNTNKKMAENVCWVARSLGFRATISEKKTSIKSIGYTGIAWRVYISGKLSEIPVKIERKKAGDKTKYKSNRYGIKAVPIGMGEYFGFTLDGDGLFLLNDFTVTHNTVILTSIAYHTRVPCAFFEIELSAADLGERLHSMHLGKPGYAIEAGARDGSLPVHQGFAHVLFCTASRLTVKSMEKQVALHNARAAAPVGCVLVDYLQLLQGPGSRYERFSNIAEDLKLMAKNLNAVVVVACQVKREEGSSVHLHSAKESGSIENSASLMLGATREGDKGERLALKILKNSKGPAGYVIDCTFDGATMRITEDIGTP